MKPIVNSSLTLVVTVCGVGRLYTTRIAVRRIRSYVDRFGLTSEDVKNLSVAAALTQMLTLADDAKTKGLLNGLLGHAKRLGLDASPLAGLSKNGGVHAGN